MRPVVARTCREQRIVLAASITKYRGSLALSIAARRTTLQIFVGAARRTTLQFFVGVSYTLRLVSHRGWSNVGEAIETSKAHDARAHGNEARGRHGTLQLIAERQMPQRSRR